jgi:hypothetical protein
MGHALGQVAARATHGNEQQDEQALSAFCPHAQDLQPVGKRQMLSKELPVGTLLEMSALASTDQNIC